MIVIFFKLLLNYILIVHLLTSKFQQHTITHQPRENQRTTRPSNNVNSKNNDYLGGKHLKNKSYLTVSF